MKTYRVKWEIDIYANSPEEAAKEALKIQRDPNSIALIFEIKGDNFHGNICLWGKES